MNEWAAKESPLRTFGSEKVDLGGRRRVEQVGVVGAGGVRAGQQLVDPGPR